MKKTIAIQPMASNTAISEKTMAVMAGAVNETYRAMVKEETKKSLLLKNINNWFSVIEPSDNKTYLQKESGHFLLRGFAFCNIHGKRLVGNSDGQYNGKKMDYYHCLSKNCRSAYNHADVLEKQTELLFANLQFSRQFIDFVATVLKNILVEQDKKINDKKIKCRYQENTLEEKRKEIESKLLTGVIGEIDFVEAIAKIKQEIRTIEIQLAELNKQWETKFDAIKQIVKFTRYAHAAYVEAPFIFKKHFLSLFFERFDVENDKIVKAVPTESFQFLVKGGYIKDFNSAKINAN